MKKSDKPIFVQKLTPQLKAATSVVLLDYTGLSVKKQQDLKKRLKKVGAEMLVVKNTLFKLAGKEAKISEESLTDSVLSGPTAMVITEEDPIAPLQVLYKFAKEFVSEAGYSVPQFKVGVVEGKFQDKDTLGKLAQLPNKDVLFAQVVGAIARPMYGLVGTLQGNIQKLLFVLNEKAKS